MLLLYCLPQIHIFLQTPDLSLNKISFRHTAALYTSQRHDPREDLIHLLPVLPHNSIHRFNRFKRDRTVERVGQLRIRCFAFAVRLRRRSF